MNLVNCRGLNCYLASIISIAASLGINYQDAFATLWSETDFSDDMQCHIYISKRILPNLEALGAKMEVINCTSAKEAAESFALILEGELFLVGIDTFFVPWSPVYQHFHGLHYFIARKEKRDYLLCYDPTYNRENMLISSRDIIPHAFDLSRVYMLLINPPKFSVSLEAQEILAKHPETQERLQTEIQKSVNKERQDIMPLIKQVCAMICNRYLFERFMHQLTFTLDCDHRFFDKSFFSRWEAVKNGLYKASVIRNNERVLNEVCDLFLKLIREETEMAKEMIML